MIDPSKNQVIMEPIKKPAVRTRGIEAVVILSGGMDSTTLLYDVMDSGKETAAVTFDYNQRHKKEILMAIKTTRRLHVPHEIIPLTVLNQIAPSCLTRPRPVPEGHYADENMKQTVVPNRNMVMLSLAAAYAIGIGATELYYGAHSGDHTIYPDCRPEFVQAMDLALALCDWHPVQLMVPYLFGNKTSILRRGQQLGVDYSRTWTCYKGREKACGRCGSCQERLEAFAEVGIKDPLEYEE